MTVEITITVEAGAKAEAPRPEPEAGTDASNPLPALLGRAAFFAALRRKADARLAAFG